MRFNGFRGYSIVLKVMTLILNSGWDMKLLIMKKYRRRSFEAEIIEEQFLPNPKTKNLYLSTLKEFLIFAKKKHS